VQARARSRWEQSQCREDDSSSSINNNGLPRTDIPMLLTAAIFLFPTSVSQLQAYARSGRRHPQNQRTAHCATTATAIAPPPPGATCPAPTTPTAVTAATATRPSSRPPMSTPSLPSTSCEPPALSPMSPRRVQPATFLPFFTPTLDAPTRRCALFLSNV